MANEKELKQINKNGILVHQLLSENKNSALSYFSIDSIEKVSHDSDGLQIFFKEYDLVVKSILRRKIEVKGLFYKIYPKVTNLTVIGIGPYITNSEIESIMKYCGFIIDSYRIQETRQENGYKTVSLTNDYRIVLDVPEVFAPKLRPIKLPNIRDKTFEVLFFCRFCRNNGHMQFQCPKVVQRSPSPFKRYPKINVSKTPYEKDYSDLVINKVRISCPKSDFCVNKRNHKTYSNHHEKNEKESNYFPDQNSYSKNSSVSSSSTHHKSKDVSRRMSYEKNSGDSIIRKNESNSHQSDFCANKRKSKTRPNFHVKIEKEQNYFPDQSCSKNSCNSSSSLYHQNIDVFSRISCEKTSGDLVNRIKESNSNQSDFCINKRNFKTRPGSHVKTEKEQNYYPNQSCSKKSCNSSSTSYHGNMDFSRRISCEKDSGDLVNRINETNSNQSDFCVKKRNSETRPDFHLKIEKEQNYFLNQSCSKKSCNSSSTSYHQNMDVYGRIPWEKDSGDLVISKNESNSHESDFCVNKQNSKIRPDSHKQNEKEQNNFHDQNCYTKKSFHSSSSTYHQSTDASRGISCENNYGDLSIENNEIDCPVSDFCVDQKISNKNSSDSHAKTKKEQNNCYRNKSNKNDSLKISYVKSTHSKPKNFYSRHKVADCVKMHRKHRKVKVSSMPTDANEIGKDNNSPAFKEQPTEIEKMDVDQHCEKKEESFEKIPASASNECSHKRTFSTNSKRKKEKKIFMKLLPSLLPPNVDLPETKKLIKIALKCDPKDIPGDVKDVLLTILKYNSGVKRKIGNNATRIFLHWVEAVLSKIMKPEKFQRENSSEDPVKHPTKEKEHDKEKEEAFERIPASTSNECSHKRTFSTNSKRKKEKKIFMKLLPKLLPPNVDLLETKKLVKIALKCDPKDIPGEVKDVLLTILKHNSGVKRKIGNKATRIFLNWVEVVLSKIMKQEKFQGENFAEDPVKHPTKEKEHDKDGKSTTGIPNEQSQRKRKITLSLGIQEAISKTPGELKPTFLCNFLNQVRGRKKLFEVASAFTKNIPALAAQLLEVRNTYYRCVGKRGPEEDRDLSYIKRLRLRLLQHSGNATDVALEREVSMAEAPSEIESDITEVPGKTESNMTEVCVKTESDMTEVCVKTESDMTEVCMKTESDMTDMPVKTESDMRGQFAEAQWNMAEMFVKTESDIAEISVKTESDMTNTFVNAELDMTKTSVGESDMREMSVETESDMREISVKRETEIFTRQFSSCEEFQALSSYSLHGASYFTNITQMPFSLTSIKSEVNYID